MVKFMKNDTLITDPPSQLVSLVPLNQNFTRLLLSSEGFLVYGSKKILESNKKDYVSLKNIADIGYRNFWVFDALQKGFKKFDLT